MNYSLTIGWLYPELMSTYGDRGNIIVLTKRSEWRGIKTKVVSIDFDVSPDAIESCDLIFGGGAQDRQQRILVDDLREKKGPVLKKMFARGIPGLFVCGAPQLLGYYYMTGEGAKLQGLGIFDFESRHFGKTKPRCIGNTVAKLNPDLHIPSAKQTIVGFENHGGRTFLGLHVSPFATSIKGCGNNGEDGTEGAVYNNCIATYSHGPFLPKNPHVADWLISKALGLKYDQPIVLDSLDDTLEWQAHDFLLSREGV